ncbi:hypothetical protein ACFZDB_24415 [Streptomyces luteogriseus]
MNARIRRPRGVLVVTAGVAKEIDDRLSLKPVSVCRQAAFGLEDW